MREILPRTAAAAVSAANPTAVRWLNPMALRFPLWDCDRFLLATLPWLRGVFTRSGALLWLLWVLPALFLAFLQRWHR